LFVRRAPNAAVPPARENGVDCTAVPNTLAFFGAPNAANSVTTLRDAIVGEVGELGIFGDLGETGVRVGRGGYPPRP
jgi:hypothetical protein